MILKLGTRSSRLALAQSNAVADALRARGHEVELVKVISKGDRILDRSLPSIGGKGLFTAELEAGLLDGSVDLAVHSLKDLPVDEAAGLVVGAVPRRAPHADVLVTRDGAGLDELPGGARVGTSSLRRRAMLLAARPDLNVVDLRGNVPTRVGKVDSGEVDAAVLAEAGLRRLGMDERCGRVLTAPVFLPAPGQGALGIQVRAGGEAAAAVAALDHPETRACVTAERTLLHTLEGGCSAPVGALALVMGGELLLRGGVWAVDGSRNLVVEASGSADPDRAEEIGVRAARELLERGAAELIEAA